MDRPERIEPGPGQESVWDYPRPPRLEPVTHRLRVVFAGEVVADTTRGRRVLETSQPPAYYFPPDDVRTDLLVPSTQRTFCEWKGQAAYHDLVVGDRRSPGATWSYARPTDAFEDIAGRHAFYAQAVDEAWVGEHRVEPNPGAFYGGWITPLVVGPFKGGPGSAWW